MAFDDTQLRGPWEQASGALVALLQRFDAQLQGLQPFQSLQQNTGALTASGLVTTDTNGAPSVSSAQPGPLAFASANVSGPVTLAASQNDYLPPNWQTAAVLVLTTSAAINLTGLTAPSPLASTVRLLVNTGTASSNAITLKHGSTSSLLPNRFRCPNLADFALTQGSAVWVWYDLNASVWSIVEKV